MIDIIKNIANSNLNLYQSHIGTSVAYTLYEIYKKRQVFFYKESNLVILNNKYDHDILPLKINILPPNNKKIFNARNISRGTELHSIIKYDEKFFNFYIIDPYGRLFEVIKGTAKHDDNTTELIIAHIPGGRQNIHLRAKGDIGAGIPLYNNYVPIVSVTSNEISLLLIDLITQKSLEIKKYPIDFFESKIQEHIKNTNSINIASLHNILTKFRSSYRVVVPNDSIRHFLDGTYKVCRNYALCKSSLYITNSAVKGYLSHELIFIISFTVKNNELHYEILIPENSLPKSLSVSRRDKSKVIDSGVLSIIAPEGNDRLPNLLYYDENCTIIRHTSVGNIEYRIIDIKGSMMEMIGITDFISNDFICLLRNRIVLEYDATISADRTRVISEIHVYNIKQRAYSVITGDFIFSGEDIIAHYFIKRCNKLILLVGDADKKCRKCPNIERIAIIDLNTESIKGHNDKNINENIYFIDPKNVIKNYIRDKILFSDSDINLLEACNVDLINEKLYLTAYIDYSNEIPKTKVNTIPCVITFECDLCTKNNTNYRFILTRMYITDNIRSNKILPIYLNYTSRKNKNISGHLHKHLHMYALIEFYGLIISSIFDSELLFRTHPNISFIDRQFNRIDGVIKNIIKYDKYRSMIKPLEKNVMLLQKTPQAKSLENVMVLQSSSNIKALFIFDDLSISVVVD